MGTISSDFRGEYPRHRRESAVKSVKLSAERPSDRRQGGVRCIRQTRGHWLALLDWAQLASTVFRYCIVGVINTGTDVSLFLFLTARLSAAAAPSNIISFTTATCVSFLLNRRFTFRHPTYALIPAVQLFRFVAINLISLIGSTVAIWLLSAIMVPIAAKLVTVPFVTAWGFLAVRLMVFQPRR